MAHNIEMLLYNLPSNLKNLYGKYENFTKKKINKTWSYKFNEICLDENVWPIYITILFCEF